MFSTNSYKNKYSKSTKVYTIGLLGDNVLGTWDCLREVISMVTESS